MTVKNTTTQPDADTTPKPGPAAAPVADATPEPAAAATEPQTDAPDATEPTDDAEGGNKAGREAAKYRRQLRDTEAERDTLTGTVDSLRRQIIAQNMPAGSKASADLLWTAGHQPADLFTPEGTVDTLKLTAAAKEAHQKFGLHFGLDPVPGSGTRSGEAIVDGPSWGDALKKGK